MLNTREKLVELFFDAEQMIHLPYAMNTEQATRYIFEQMADHLIANGVTVQKEAKLYWKPVKPGEWNLTCSACDSHLGCREGAKHCPECGAKFVYPKAVAPQPPKGE